MQRLSRKKHHPSRQQDGFTLLQVLISVAIIAIVSTFGFLGIVNARAMTRVQNSARLFALYAEKARADSIRRHATAGSEAFIQTFGEGTNTYIVRMDFDGSGVLQTRSFILDEGVTFNNVAQTATFDWRGRIFQSLVYQIYSQRIVTGIPVDISGSGDITIDSQVFADNLIPGIALTPITGDLATVPTPEPTATPTPTPNPDPNATPFPTPTPYPTPTPTPCTNNGVNCRTPTPTPTPTPAPTPTPTPQNPTPTPTPMPQQCASSVTPSTLSLSQSDSTRHTGTAVFTLSNASGTHTISAATGGNGAPLTLSVSPASLSGSGTATVTISAKAGNGNRGTFTVNISASPSCGSTQTVTVSVGN